MVELEALHAVPRGGGKVASAQSSGAAKRAALVLCGLPPSSSASRGSAKPRGSSQIARDLALC
eukprot:6649660-Alexandrium_andersonii.AAC.1